MTRGEKSKLSPNQRVEHNRIMQSLHRSSTSAASLCRSTSTTNSQNKPMHRSGTATRLLVRYGQIFDASRLVKPGYGLADVHFEGGPFAIRRGTTIWRW
jgi:hypothetical protein